MNYGFDLEGTLDAEPAAFMGLCEALVRTGHGVYVITAYYCAQGIGYDPIQESLRRSQLASIGFLLGVDYTALVFAPGDTAESQAEMKRAQCVGLNIGLMFEDRSDFTSVISKTTRCLLMQLRE